VTIAEDTWLTGVAGRPFWRVGDDGPADVARHAAAHPGSVYAARVDAADTARVAALEGIGFRVVDCGVTLTRPPLPAPPDPPGVVAAAPAHVEDVAAIGASAFATSRFHLDPRMPPGLADRIKAEWARNCAAGLRGAGTIVALREGRPAGFLAVLADGADRVIDLVAVAPAHRGRGVGRALVSAFIARWGPGARELRVGTQAANVASLRLYGSTGFRVSATAYALHLHA
jgi:dTDP-4-amino-4,6-dideoxy-D-galactose acyltransferase